MESRFLGKERSRRIDGRSGALAGAAGAVAAALAAAGPAHAGLIVENNLLYYTNSLTTTSADSASRLFESFTVGASIPKIYQIGWTVNFVSQGDTAAGATNTLSGTEMGPRVGIFLGKEQHFNVAVAYLPLAKGTYTAGSSSPLSLSGMGFQGEIGYAPQVGKNLFAGFKLIYHSVTYSSSTDASSKTSDVSYSSSGFIPAFYLSWRLGTQQ